MSFLHDVNGLQLAAQAANPLVVIVVNNGGGRIFEQLPIARLGKEEWLPYFTTPHDASMAGAASIYGCAFEVYRNNRRFDNAVSEAFVGNFLHIPYRSRDHHDFRPTFCGGFCQSRANPSARARDQNNATGKILFRWFEVGNAVIN